MRPAPTGNDTDNVVIPKHLRDVTIVEQKSQTTCSVWPQYTGYTVYRLYFVLPSLLFACFLHTQHTAVCSTSCICIKCLYYSCLFLFFLLKKKKGYQLVGKAASILCIYIDIQCVSVVDFDWLFTVSMVTNWSLGTVVFPSVRRPVLFSCGRTWCILKCQALDKWLGTKAEICLKGLTVLTEAVIFFYYCEDKHHTVLAKYWFAGPAYWFFFILNSKTEKLMTRKWNNT